MKCWTTTSRPRVASKSTSSATNSRPCLHRRRSSRPGTCPVSSTIHARRRRHLRRRRRRRPRARDTPSNPTRALGARPRLDCADLRPSGSRRAEKGPKTKRSPTTTTTTRRERSDSLDADLGRGDRQRSTPSRSGTFPRAVASSTRSSLVWRRWYSSDERRLEGREPLRMEFLPAGAPSRIPSGLRSGGRVCVSPPRVAPTRIHEFLPASRVRPSRGFEAEARTGEAIVSGKDPRRRRGTGRRLERPFDLRCGSLTVCGSWSEGSRVRTGGDVE